MCVNVFCWSVFICFAVSPFYNVIKAHSKWRQTYWRIILEESSVRFYPRIILKLIRKILKFLWYLFPRYHTTVVWRISFLSRVFLSVWNYSHHCKTYHSSLNVFFQIYCFSFTCLILGRIKYKLGYTNNLIWLVDIQISIHSQIHWKSNVTIKWK